MERQELIRIIQLKLKELIDNDYILLDLPYYYNVGDVLIWQSTHDILKNIKYKCLYSSSIETYIKPPIKKGIIIIIMGGGNFGDLWVDHQEFRHKVMRDFPDNPILQLPQSVCFENQSYLAEDINCFKSHRGKISICLRDKNSYDFIKANYKNVDSYLVPDMVFAFDVTKYCKIKKGEGAIFIKRTDKEQSVIDNNRIPADAIVRDWPLMGHYDNKLLCVFHAWGLLYRLNLTRNENIYKKIDDFL